jgi:hypothetical protein
VIGPSGEVRKERPAQVISLLTNAGREFFRAYLFAVPRTIFFTLRLSEPRGAVRFALGAAFLRAARLAFLRSSLLSVFVFAMGELMVNEKHSAVSRLSLHQICEISIDNLGFS